MKRKYIIGIIILFSLLLFIGSCLVIHSTIAFYLHGDVTPYLKKIKPGMPYYEVVQIFTKDGIVRDKEIFPSKYLGSGITFANYDSVVKSHMIVKDPERNSKTIGHSQGHIYFDANDKVVGISRSDTSRGNFRPDWGVRISDPENNLYIPNHDGDDASNP